MSKSRRCLPHLLYHKCLRNLLFILVLFRYSFLFFCIMFISVTLIQLNHDNLLFISALFLTFIVPGVQRKPFPRTYYSLKRNRKISAALPPFRHLFPGAPADRRQWRQSRNENTATHEAFVTQSCDTRRPT